MSEPFRYPDGPAPFALKTERPRVWHYTNADGLLGILNTKQIWASSPKALNDLEEIKFGMQRMWKAFGDFQTRNSIKIDNAKRMANILSVDFLTTQIDEIFIVSASSSNDSLNQWQHYSEVDGFAIELDTSIPMGLRLKSGETVFSRNQENYFFPGWYDVVYEETEQNAIIDEMFKYLARMTDDPSYKDDYLLNLVARMIVMPQIARFKHNGFRDEREVRFLAGNVAGSPVEYRSSNGRVVPYINLVRHYEPSGPSGNGLDFIKGIVCSPTTNQNDVQLVRDIIASFGLNNPTVTRSSIPFRR